MTFGSKEEEALSVKWKKVADQRIIFTKVKSRVSHDAAHFMLRCRLKLNLLLVVLSNVLNSLDMIVKL